MKNKKEDFLTARETARILGCTLMDVTAEIRAGRLPAFRDHTGLYQIRRKDVVVTATLLSVVETYRKRK